MPFQIHAAFSGRTSYEHTRTTLLSLTQRFPAPSIVQPPERAKAFFTFPYAGGFHHRHGRLAAPRLYPRITQDSTRWHYWYGQKVFLRSKYFYEQRSE